MRLFLPALFVLCCAAACASAAVAELTDITGAVLVTPATMTKAEQNAADMLLDEVKQAGNAASVNWERVDFFRPYGGIRIEDEVLCTGGDADNLTRPVFAAQP